MILPATRSSGITMRAQVPSPGTLSSELIVRAVDDAQPLVDVPQADAARLDALGLIGGDADPVVDDVDDRVAVLGSCGS